MIWVSFQGVAATIVGGGRQPALHERKKSPSPFNLPLNRDCYLTIPDLAASDAPATGRFRHN